MFYPELVTSIWYYPETIKNLHVIKADVSKDGDKTDIEHKSGTITTKKFTHPNLKYSWMNVRSGSTRGSVYQHALFMVGSKQF